MFWLSMESGTLWKVTDKPLQDELSIGMPRAFLTGDGHRHPPFEWIQKRPSLKAHILNLVQQNKLCVHVEEQQADVSVRSVGADLHPVVNNGKVFGWELPIFALLKPIMEACVGPIPSPHNAMRLADDMLEAHTRLSEVQNPGDLANMTDRILRFRAHFEALAQEGLIDSPREDEVQSFLLAYYNAAMQMRTTTNPDIARGIQTRMHQYPDHTHLITCGFTHIHEQPLQNYISLPGDMMGVVDASGG